MPKRKRTKKTRFIMQGDQAEIWPRAISVFKHQGFVRENVDEHAMVREWQEMCDLMPPGFRDRAPHFPYEAGQTLGLRVAFELGLDAMKKISKEELAARVREIFE